MDRASCWTSWTLQAQSYHLSLESTPYGTTYTRSADRVEYVTNSVAHYVTGLHRAKRKLVDNERLRIE